MLSLHLSDWPGLTLFSQPTEGTVSVKPERGRCQVHLSSGSLTSQLIGGIVVQWADLFLKEK